MVAMIQGLIERATPTPGTGTLFSVHRDEDYGRLSGAGWKTAAGARVEVGEMKKTPLDFALWKAAKPVNRPGTSRG